MIQNRLYFRYCQYSIAVYVFVVIIISLISSRQLLLSLLLLICLLCCQRVVAVAIVVSVVVVFVVIDVVIMDLANIDFQMTYAHYRGTNLETGESGRNILDSFVLFTQLRPDQLICQRVLFRHSKSLKYIWYSDSQIPTPSCDWDP